MTFRGFASGFVVIALVALSATLVLAQVEGALLDANTASAEELAALPHMTAETVKQIDAARPFGSIVDMNAALTGAGLSAEQAAELYAKAFVRVNLNTASEAEFLLIPGVGHKMAHEFEEYRPWKSQEQFERTIGKYVDEAEVARLWRYVVIP